MYGLSPDINKDRRDEVETEQRNEEEIKEEAGLVIESNPKQAVLDARNFEEKKAMGEQEREKLGHNHPLFSLKLNLLEISHRDIEKIEKFRHKLIANGTNADEDMVKFKDFVFDCLIRKEEISGINAAR